MTVTVDVIVIVTVTVTVAVTVTVIVIVTVAVIVTVSVTVIATVIRLAITHYAHGRAVMANGQSFGSDCPLPIEGACASMGKG